MPHRNEYYTTADPTDEIRSEDALDIWDHLRALMLNNTCKYDVRYGEAVRKFTEWTNRLKYWPPVWNSWHRPFATRAPPSASNLSTWSASDNSQREVENVKCANDRAVSWNSGRLPVDNEVRRPFKADRRPPDFITLTGVTGGASDDIAVVPTVWRRRSRDGTRDLAEQVAPGRAGSTINAAVCVLSDGAICATNVGQNVRGVNILCGAVASRGRRPQIISTSSSSSAGMREQTARTGPPEPIRKTQPPAYGFSLFCCSGDLQLLVRSYLQTSTDIHYLPTAFFFHVNGSNLNLSSADLTTTLTYIAFTVIISSCSNSKVTTRLKQHSNKYHNRPSAY